MDGKIQVINNKSPIDKFQILVGTLIYKYGKLNTMTKKL
jgi:hypothetical protein